MEPVPPALEGTVLTTNCKEKFLICSLVRVGEVLFSADYVSELKLECGWHDFVFDFYQVEDKPGSLFLIL